MDRRAAKGGPGRKAAVLLAWAAGVAAQAAVPDSDSTTFPANYQGMYLGPNSPPETMSCASTETFITTNGNADCCVGTTCNVPVTCTNSVLSYGNGDTYSCGEGYSCQAMTIYQTSPFGLPVVTQWMCAINWSANTIYREIVVTTHASTHPGTATGPTPSQTRTAPLNTASADPGQPQPSDDGSSSSKAWIAGPVIGGLAAIALLGGLAFWWGRRAARGKNRPGGDASGAVDAEMSNRPPLLSPPGGPPPDTPYAATAGGGYTDGKGYYYNSPGPTTGPSPAQSPAASWGPGAPSPYATTTYSTAAAGGGGGAGGGGYTPVSQHAQFGGGVYDQQQHHHQHPSELPSTVPVEMDGRGHMSPGGPPAAELAGESPAR